MSTFPPIPPLARARWAWISGRISLLALLCTPTFVSAQITRSEDPRQSAGLRQVDQGFADQNALSASSRAMPIDLRQPAGFDQLFQLTGPGGRLETRGTESAGLFFRISGGLVASFPRSTYEPAANGWQALIPPGTVFSIGEIPAWGPRRVPSERPAPTSLRRAGESNAQAPQRSARSHGAPTPGTSSPSPRSIAPKNGPSPTSATRSRNETGSTEIDSLWTSEAVRRRLIERLIFTTASDRKSN